MLRPVRATGGSLRPCGRYLLAPLTWNKEGRKGLVILRVKPTLTRFFMPPMDNTPLDLIPCVVLLLFRYCAKSSIARDDFDVVGKNPRLGVLMSPQNK